MIYYIKNYDIDVNMFVSEKCTYVFIIVLKDC